jgi:hypothetical protein
MAVVTTSTTPARESAARPRTEETAPEAASGMLQTLSHMIYSGSYALAYGVVYVTVFVVQSLPQENPVLHGFHDGGKAAMDELAGS